MCEVHTVNSLSKLCLSGRCAKEAVRILANSGCHWQKPTSQGHGLSAVGLVSKDKRVSSDHNQVYFELSVWI